MKGFGSRKLHSMNANFDQFGSVIFVNKNESGEKRENNEFVNEN